MTRYREPRPGDWSTDRREAWEIAARAWTRAAATPALGELLAFDEVKSRPWSAVRRAGFEHGVAWFKAAGTPCLHEAALVPAIARTGCVPVPDVLAQDVPRGWLLLADAGTALRERDPHDRAVLAAVARAMARLQVHVIRNPGCLPDGLPDRRPAALPGLYDRLVTALEADPPQSVAPGSAGESLAQRMRRRRPDLLRAADALHDSPLASTLDHGDLHPGNVLEGPEIEGERKWRVVDWGDASRSHAAFSLMVLVADLPSGDMCGAVERAFAQPFLDAGIVDATRFATDLAHARSIAPVHRALDFVHCLADTTPRERAPWWSMLAEVLAPWAGR